MGVRSDWPELASIINKGLASMSLEEHNAIRNRWYSVTYTSKTDYSLVWKILLVMLMVALAIIYWNRLLRLQVRKRTAELSDSEARFRATFEQAAVGIAHVSPEGRFLRLNQKFCDIVGYSQEEMLKLTFQDITHPDDLDADLHLFQELLDGKSDSYTMEKRYIRKDGSIVWISLTVKILRNEDGSPRWFVSVIEDISDRIRIQDEVHKSYEFLNHLTKTIPDAIFSVKLPERTVTWCTDTYGVLGYEAQECIGESTEKLYPGPVDVEKIGALIDNAISNENETVQTEIMLRRKNGEIFPVEAKLAFQKEDDRVVSVTALLRDISERKRAEKKLQESHDYLKHLVSSIPDAIFRVKLPERVIDWVEDYSNIMGARDATEMYGQPTRNYFASEDEYNAFGEMQRQAIEYGKDFMLHEIMVRRLDGTIFPAEVTASFFRENGNVKYATALVRDITERRQAEKKILDYQKHLKALASQLTLAEEKERRRIAADLHDDIGQTLAMTRLQLAAAIRACDCTGSKHHGMLEEISGTLLKAIQDTRQLIFELGSAAIHEIGLGAAISEWVDEKLKTLDDEIDFDLVDNLNGDMLEEEQRVILFRNIRELLTNIIKHARARKVKIILEIGDHEIHITVQDDGIGFNPELISGESNQESGYGIFSIEERMADLGGRLEINSAPHKGCCITMSLPIVS
jgi:PAS domain S-box-containing protein